MKERGEGTERSMVGMGQMQSGLLREDPTRPAPGAFGILLDEQHCWFYSFMRRDCR